MTSVTVREMGNCYSTGVKLQSYKIIMFQREAILYFIPIINNSVLCTQKFVKADCMLSVSSAHKKRKLQNKQYQ